MKQKIAILIIIFGLFLPSSFVSAGTVLSSYKYAWSDNVGYINFENVLVSDSALSGYAWSANYGWIKFNPTQSGVVNDGTGNLSGSAWGSNLGWIDFNNVYINGGTGEFSGTATGELVGTITFDCPNYCDVRTDWRQAVSPPVSSNGGGGGGGGAIPVSLHVNVNDAPLNIAPEQSGTLIQVTSLGEAALEIPKNTVKSKTTFTLIEELLDQSNEYLIIGGTKLAGIAFFNIIARDQDGNEIRSFLNPITITLPVPTDLDGAKNLGAYWLNETNWQWVLIPDAVFASRKATFKVSHLTKFAIFMTTDEVSKVPVSLIPSLPLPVKKKPMIGNVSEGQPIPERSRTSTDNINESLQPVKYVNWKLVASFIILSFFILFVFLKKR